MPKTTSSARAQTKSDIVQQLLKRKSGATLASLKKATGSQPHSVRAALSTLRKSGYTIDKLPQKTDNGTVVYQIAATPTRA